MTNQTEVQIVRVPLRIENRRNQALAFDITDRPTTVKTTAMGADAGLIPPLSELTTYLADDEVIVFGDNTIKIEKVKEKE